MIDAAENESRLPALKRDPAFLGITCTQLLGAFNDNVFKQLLVLYYIDLAVKAATLDSSVDAAQLATTYQSVAFMVFSLPFVLFSGVAGWWSDRVVKRDIVIGSKIAELGVMVLGLLAFLSGNFYAPFVVLFLMATQSTFFGPSKYGILPEMLRERDLPAANGLVQMTTFLAIILGTVVAGVGKDFVETDAVRSLAGNGSLWIVSAFCAVIAVLGTYTATWIRRTPIAHPDLPLTADAIFLSKETTNAFRSDRRLFNALFVVSVFWFVAGVCQLTVNEFGKLQLGAGDTGTSLLQASLAIGIAIGCVVCGTLSNQRVRPEFVQRGALGLAGSLVLLSLVGFSHEGEAPAAGSLLVMAGGILFLLGFSTGFFVVPLQVVLQARSPRSLKGRIIAAQNLFNFVGLFAAGAAYWALGQLCRRFELPISTVFGVMGFCMVAIALAYRPPAENHADTEREAVDGVSRASESRSGETCVAS